MAQPDQLAHLPYHSDAEADLENHPLAMSETQQHLKDRHMILAEDGFLRFVPPAGCAFSEDQLAKIVHCMASINAELMLSRLTENHPNQPNEQPNN